MRKLTLFVAAVVVASSLAGCSCRRPFANWFNRGDDCNDVEPGCVPGVPQGAMMIPSSPQMMPGPIEIAPTN